MIETRGAAVYKKKISKCKNPNLKEEKACTEKMGKKQVCRSDKKSNYKKVSSNEKDVACGSKRKSFSVRDSEEEKGKKKSNKMAMRFLLLVTIRRYVLIFFKLFFVYF